MDQAFFRAYKEYSMSISEDLDMIRAARDGNVYPQQELLPAIARVLLILWESYIRKPSDKR
jgi:hypothetical protein